MKLYRIYFVVLILFPVLNLNGQTLEEREKEIVRKNNIQTKIQYDHKNETNKPAASGTKLSVTTYSEKGEILKEQYYNPKGEVVNWERYEYDDNGNRILYERESNNSKYKKASRYNESNQTILESGFSGEEHFRTTYTYTVTGKPLEIIRYVNGNPEEKMVYNHSGNSATVSIYSKGSLLTSKLKLIYDSKGNILEETVMSIDNRELEKKTFKYSSASQLLSEEKTRGGNFFYNITNVYDTKGNLIKVYEETITKKKYLKKEYTFDSSGNLVSYKWRRNPDNEFNEKKYTYNPAGVCLTEQTYYPKTKYRSLVKYSYTYY